MVEQGKGQIVKPQAEGPKFAIQLKPNGQAQIMFPTMSPTDNTPNIPMALKLLGIGLQMVGDLAARGQQESKIVQVGAMPDSLLKPQ